MFSIIAQLFPRTLGGLGLDFSIHQWPKVAVCYDRHFDNAPNCDPISLNDTKAFS